MTDPARTPTGASPVFYLSMLPGLLELAKEHGYSLAVHGSLKRDFDLIAIPWVDDAKPRDELVKAIMAATGARPRSAHAAQERAHGRWTFGLYLGGGPYIDLSIMPRACDAAHHMQPNEVIHCEDEGI